MPSFITHKPVDNISQTSSEFGERVPPNPNASTKHDAIDFPVPAGSNVYAANTGIITTVGSNVNSGNFIILTSYDEGGHQIGSTSYSHLNSYAQIRDSNNELRRIEEGDNIVAGTERGQVNYQTNQLPVQKLLVIL